MPTIHPTAIVDSAAKLAADVAVGPYSIIGANVQLDAGVKVHSHVVIDGHTTIGEGTEIFPFAAVGVAPQDVSYKGEPTRLEIGKNNVIREHCTLQPGTLKDQGLTKVGDNNLIMVGTHVAHDCIIGNNNWLTNNVMLAGHVVVEDFCVIGGLTGIHRSCHIGSYSIIGGASAVDRDVLPFSMAVGNRAVHTGLNLRGLRRREFPRETIKALKEAQTILFNNQQTLDDKVKVLKKFDVAEIKQIVAFIERSERGLSHAADDITTGEDA